MRLPVPACPGAEVSFTVPGDPVAKGRPRFGPGSVYTPIRTLAAEGSVGWAAKAAISKPLTGPLMLELVFHTKTLRRSDIDNLAKTVLDGCNGIAYLDDSQIIALSASRFLDRVNPRTEITIRPKEAA